MRRALAGIVPDAILNRKRKAYGVGPSPATISTQWAVAGASSKMVSSDLGIVNSEAFLHALGQSGKQGAASTIPLLRTLSLELWLRNLRMHGVFAKEAC
jgi:hypothetical protein